LTIAGFAIALLATGLFLSFQRARNLSLGRKIAFAVGLTQAVATLGLSSVALYEVDRLGRHLEAFHEDTVVPLRQLESITSTKDQMEDSHPGAGAQGLPAAGAGAVAGVALERPLVALTSTLQTRLPAHA
jgi:hypothetical protein